MHLDSMKVTLSDIRNSEGNFAVLSALNDFKTNMYYSKIHDMSYSLERIQERTGDVIKILDSFDEIEKSLNVSIDRDRVALGGHSYGAITTQVFSGAKIMGVEAEGTFKSFGVTDPRLKCALMLSPLGPFDMEDTSKNNRPLRLFFTKDSFGGDVLPFMVITGTDDVTGLPLEETYEWRLTQYNASQGVPKFKVIPLLPP